MPTVADVGQIAVVVCGNGPGWISVGAGAARRVGDDAGFASVGQVFLAAVCLGPGVIDVVLRASATVAAGASGTDIAPACFAAVG